MYIAEKSRRTLARSLKTLHSPPANVSAMVLVEPVMVPPPILDNDPRIARGKTNVAGVLSRRDRWDNVADVRAWLTKRFPYKIWEPRIIELYVVSRASFVPVAVEPRSQFPRSTDSESSRTRPGRRM